MGGGKAAGGGEWGGGEAAGGGRKGCWWGGVGGRGGCWSGEWEEGRLLVVCEVGGRGGRKYVVLATEHFSSPGVHRIHQGVCTTVPKGSR